jgi:hypothetical protein
MKTTFTDVELEQIKSIQERSGCSRKTAIKKFKQAEAAAKSDVKKAAANDKPEASSTMTPEERGKAQAEGLRLFKLAGRPSKKDLLAGWMRAAQLYESPFTDFSPRGVEGVFDSAQVTQLLAVLDNIRQAAAAS